MKPSIKGVQLLLVLFALCTVTYGQNQTALRPNHPGRVVIEGTVVDDSTGQIIPRATVQVIGEGTAMAANRDGRFRLILPSGQHKIKASHVGYYSTQFEVSLSDSLINKEIRLKTMIIDMGERIVYTRAYDPAQRIILQAIAHKKDILSRIHDYTYDAYTRMVARQVSKPDSENIAVIAETQSTAFWEKPDKFKEVINARRQSAGLSSENNTIVAGLPMNFNQNRIEIFNYSVVSPTATDALDHYNYYLLDTVYIDSRTTFVLELEPKNDYEPLFVGKIFIVDSTFDVIKVDVGASKGLQLPVLKNLHHYQQLAPVNGDYWLPIEAGYSGQLDIDIVPDIAFELVCAFSNYKIETGHPKGTFSEYDFEVSEKADNVDSATWFARQMIPLTAEELRGYHRLDSLAKLPTPWYEKTSEVALTGVFLMLGLNSEIYRFNRVEGHYLGCGFGNDGKLLPRTRLNAKVGYAFSDKKWQYRFGGSYKLWEKGKLWIGGSIKDEITHRPTIISGSRYNATFDAFFLNEDPLDYYREKGYRVFASLRPIYHTRLDLAYRDFNQDSKPNQAFHSALHRVFYDSRTHRKNLPIEDGKLRSVTTVFSYDSREMIKDKDHDRISYALQYFSTETGIEYASPDFIANDFDFRRYYLRFDAHKNIFGQFSLWGYLGGSDGHLPPQKYFSVDFGSPDVLRGEQSFGTFGSRNFGGDRAALIYASHNSGHYMFRHSGIGLLKKIPFGLNIHGGAMWTEFKQTPLAPSNDFIRTAPTAYTEIGFGLTNLTPFLKLFNLSAYFTWQLSAYDTEKFAFTWSLFGLGM